MGSEPTSSSAGPLQVATPTVRTEPASTLQLATSTSSDAKLSEPGSALQVATPAATPALLDFDLVGAFLSGKSPTTLRAYGADLRDFARFLGMVDPGPAISLLVSGSAGQGNALAIGYRAHLLGRKLSAATVARRLAALRSIVKLARTVGRIEWALEVAAPRGDSYRDTAGPGDDGWRAVLDLAKADASAGGPKALRDLAIVRLLHDLGLRRGELVELDLADVDDRLRSVSILGKGRMDRERLTLPEPVRKALAAWLEVRGDSPGPLFRRLDPGKGRGGAGKARLSDDGVYKLVQALGRRAGLTRPLRPHGLRHHAITSALDRSGGDLRAGARFSRHRDLRTLTRYDDNRKDLGGAMAALVSDE